MVGSHFIKTWRSRPHAAIAFQSRKSPIGDFAGSVIFLWMNDSFAGFTTPPNKVNSHRFYRSKRGSEYFSALFLLFCIV